MNKIILRHFNRTTYTTETYMLIHIHNIHLQNTDDGGQVIGEKVEACIDEQVNHAHTLVR